jgi:hypothetical protein
MGKWSEYISSEEYQNLPLQAKRDAKNDYWNNTLSQREDVKKMSPEENKKFLAGFFTPKAEEGLPEATPNKFFRALNTTQAVLHDLPIVQQGDNLTANLANLMEKPENQITNIGKTDKTIDLKDTPQFMAAEVVRSLNPSSMITFTAAAKGLGMTAKAAAPMFELLPTSMKNNLKNIFKVGGSAPDEYLAARDARNLEAGAGKLEADATARSLFYAPNDIKYTVNGKEQILKAGQKLPDQWQDYVGRIFRGDFKQIPLDSPLKSHPLYKELDGIASEGRKVMDSWSQKLIDSGIPSEATTEAIKGNIGSYMARMFTKKAAESGEQAASAKVLRLRLNGLKHRKDLSEEVLKGLGEIKSPALPVGKRVSEISESIANKGLFDKVAANTEWSAAENITGKMIKMPETQALGSLSGKYVVPEIAADINAIYKPAADGLLASYQKALSMWKFGKVVLNPATHMRNMFTNTIMLDLSGVNHARQAMLFPKVISDYASKGEIYKQAVKHGAIGGEFYGAEVKAIQDHVLKVGKKANAWDLLKLQSDKAGKLYQAEEQFAKLTKFHAGLEDGLSAADAAKEAQKWLFDYNKIPKVIDVARQSASPFITFSYKAIPRVAETLVDRPLKIYKYKVMIDSFNNMSKKMLGMDDKQFKAEMDALPPYAVRNVAGFPMQLMMPYKDKYNRAQVQGLENISPTAMGSSVFAEEQQQPGVLNSQVFSHPVFPLISGLTSGRDFRGNKIVSPIEDDAMKIPLTAKWAAEQLVPPLTPGLGYSFNAINDARVGKPAKDGKDQTLGGALMDKILGIKITPVDKDRSQMFKVLGIQSKVKELQKEAIKAQRPNVTPKERAVIMKKINKKLQSIGSGK